MAMKRVQSEVDQTELSPKPLRQALDFDDSAIRTMLRGAYDDFVGDELELQVHRLLGFFVVPDPTPSERDWAELGCRLDRADLRLFWNIFVQKQIVCFDQEATLLLNLADGEKW
jgi:hypothetical protein